MAKTVQDALTKAREILQDAMPSGYRYSEDEAIRYLNDGLIQSRRMRPDAWMAYIGRTTPSYTNLTVNATFPIDDYYFDAIVFYMVGMISARDDEHELQQRAQTMLQTFKSNLVMPVGL